MISRRYLVIIGFIVLVSLAGCGEIEQNQGVEQNQDVEQSQEEIETIEEYNYIDIDNGMSVTVEINKTVLEIQSDTERTVDSDAEKVRLANEDGNYVTGWKETTTANDLEEGDTYTVYLEISPRIHYDPITKTSRHYPAVPGAEYAVIQVDDEEYIMEDGELVEWDEIKSNR